ncbi:MAG: energy-coupling factor transporter transmembrane component T [Candidatus Limnocylindrales bacterium]
MRRSRCHRRRRARRPLRRWLPELQPGVIGEAETRGRLPAFVVRLPSGPYRSLNPVTKLVIALVEVALAFVLGSWSGPLLVLGVVVVCATWAGVTRGIGVIAAVTIPVVISILLINTFLFPGATDAIVRFGPFAPTWTGLAFGVQVTIRLLAASLALALAYLTTQTDDLLTELEGRGFGRRATFLIGAAIETVPRTITRAGEIVDAQRARGLDTEGPWWHRGRGILPLAAPVVFGALTEVEERTMALEARAFSTPARRTVLRRLPDSALQGWLRRGLLVGLGVILVGRVLGPLGWIP